MNFDLLKAIRERGMTQRKFARRIRIKHYNNTKKDAKPS